MINIGAHLLKLDPDKFLTPVREKAIVSSGTNGIIIGGTQGITRTKVEELLERTDKYPGNRIIEISCEEAIVPGADVYWVPIVLNAKDSRWIIGEHGKAISRMSSTIPWERIVPIGYIVLNPQSAVGVKSEVRNYHNRELQGIVKAACKLLQMKVIYIEYSGIFGDPQLVASIRAAAGEAHLVYGGGIAAGWQAVMMKQLCDTIVIGNALYDCPEDQLSSLIDETINALGFKTSDNK